MPDDVDPAQVNAKELTLPFINTKALAVDPKNNKRILVSNDQGIYETQDQGLYNAESENDRSVLHVRHPPG